MSSPDHEVAILGGGLAGLCLAIQLKLARPGIDVLVLERRTSSAPDAAHKVGESSVEVGSQYFTEVLGLREMLDRELPKFGLRFFFSRGDNQDIARRFELGPSHFLYVPSFQIDRGHFENALMERCRDLGVTVREGVARGVELGEHHTVTLADGETITSRWLVDATGRAAVLKRSQKLSRKNGHDTNAAWFRIDASLDIDEWSEDPFYRSRVHRPRRLSTNHLMGPGYWVWVIPLRQDRTSIGIVADEKLHPFDEIRTLDRTLEWLRRHEPQLADELAPHRDQHLDFRTLRHYSHDCEQVFGDRWFITGEAGVFADPLYSPGSDFIGIANIMIGDLILRQHAGEDVTERTAAMQRTFASLHRTVLTIYQGQYPLMGHERVMSLKILWDFTMYWAGIAPLFRNHCLHDPEFMENIGDNLLELAGLGLRMQRFLKRWAKLDERGDRGGWFDYAEVPFLQQLNRALLEEVDRPTLLARQQDNLQLIRDLDREIRAHGAATVPGLARFAGELEPPSQPRIGPELENVTGKPAPQAPLVGQAP